MGRNIGLYTWEGLGLSNPKNIKTEASFTAFQKDLLIVNSQVLKCQV